MASFRQSLRDLLRPLRSFAASPRQPSAHPRERGFALLTSHLTLAQRKQYASHGYFEVIGGDTGQRYRIRHGCLMNVERLDQNGRRIQCLCFTPRGRLPIGDSMLAQKIALELFETDALGVANRTLAWDAILAEEVRMARRSRRW
jgi:hypothetical protein